VSPVMSYEIEYIRQALHIQCISRPYTSSTNCCFSVFRSSRTYV